MAEIIDFNKETAVRKSPKGALYAGHDFIINLVQASPTFFVAIDPEGKTLFMNDSLLRVLGHTLEEVVGTPYLTTFVSESPGLNIYTNPEGTVTPKGPVFFEYCLTAHDGRTLFVEWNVHPVFKENGELEYFIGVGIDVTQKRLVEKALQDNEARYRILAENVIDVIWTMDLDMHFTYLSPSVTRLLGYQLKDVSSLSLERLLSSSSLELAMSTLAEEMALEQLPGKDIFRTRMLELELIYKDGSTVWTENKVRFLYDSNGRATGILGVTRDITERKRAEKEKEIIQTQLLQAKKMEAVGILAGGIAHDFNNLLMVILGYSELLATRLPPGTPLINDIEAIKKAVERGSALTRQLLTVSRKGVMQSTVFEVNTIVGDMEKLLRRLIGEDIHLVSSLAPGPTCVKGDPGQLGQVVMNLAANARDSMPSGGTLTITTGSITLDDDQCRSMADSKPGAFVHLTVQDTGTGMNEETIQHIFDPFFTTKGHGKGTGLGLSIVYGIVKQHDGWINVSSEPGQGTTFSIYLPAFSGESCRKTYSKASACELRGNREGILLVEDEDEVREFIEKALHINGYEVFAASNVREALNVFQRQGTRIDLLLSDVVLPDGTGIQLADQLAARNPALQVLLSSGYTEQKSQWDTISSKGYGFLQKPYQLAALLNTLQRALAPQSTT
ncbi:MAG: PAS domain S-box protein [bacterium]